MSRTRRIFHFNFILFSCDLCSIVKFEMGNEIQNITYVIRNCYFKVLSIYETKKKKENQFSHSIGNIVCGGRQSAMIINSNAIYSSFSLKLPEDLIINKVIADIQFFFKYVSYSISDVIV